MKIYFLRTHREKIILNVYWLKSWQIFVVTTNEKILDKNNPMTNLNKKFYVA